MSPIMSRSPSVASNDRFSTTSGLTSATQVASSGSLQHVNPKPAYVAPFGAAQVVSEHRPVSRRPSSSEDEGGKADDDDVKFSDPALVLVNRFLDYLLFSFLATARSTNLHALKPAVTDVLKARLARDAIASAEEELQELLAGGEDEEEENTKQNAAENNRRWDLELVWKRTRLRVMVYMRLGEMEDDDEERYVKEEELFHAAERRFSQTSGLVSWAAAIFLTGVLEYIAEQTLQVAGSAAHSRIKRQSRSVVRPTTPQSATAAAESRAKVIVEEHDVEKVALNSTFGRLWRTWRKNLRASAAAAAQQSSPTRRLSRFGNDNPSSTTYNQRGRIGTAGESTMAGDTPPPRMKLDDVPEMQFPEHVLASNIPLPIGDNQRDLDEIEVPGLARDPDAQEEGSHPVTAARRNSFTGTMQTTGGLPTPGNSPNVPEDSAFGQKPKLSRKRSVSVPTPARTPLALEDMPGAFPEEPEDQEKQNLEDKRDQQKAHAEEMAPHKRASMDASGLLGGTASEDSDNGNRPAAQNDVAEGPGLLGGAVAAASVAAEAGGPAVRTSKELERNAPGSEPVTTNGSQDVEELDKRKSLMDMKDLIASSQPNTSSNGSGDEAPKVVRQSSDESKKSYTLRKNAVPQQSPATRQHMPGDAATPGEDSIGMARTSDTVQGSPSQNAIEGEARGPTKRPSRLVLGATPRKSPLDSPTTRQGDSPARSSPRDFLESRSLTSKTERPGSSGKPTAAAQSDPSRATPTSKVQKRRSIPGVAFTSAAATPVVEKNQHRQSWSAALQHQRDQHQDGGATRPVSVPAVPSVPATHKPSPSQSQGANVQEHPVIQRMASLKRDSKKSRSADLDSESMLTSASIRGPQDFDTFIQGGDTVKYTLTPETVRERPVSVSQSSQSVMQMKALLTLTGAERICSATEAGKWDSTVRSAFCKELWDCGDARQSG